MTSKALVKQGKLAADSRTVLGRYGIGIAIPQGAPKPDFSSVEAFKRALLDAKAIATSGQGSSGRYVETMLDRMGIGAQVKPKIKSGERRQRRAVPGATRGRLRRDRIAAGDRRSRRRMGGTHSGRGAALGAVHRPG